MTPPFLRKCLSGYKAIRGDRNGLNAPVRTGFVRVNDIEWKTISGNSMLCFKLEEMLLYVHETRITDCMHYEAYLPWDKALEQEDATIRIFVVPCGERRKY